MVRAVISGASLAVTLSLASGALATEKDPWFGPDKWLHFGVSAALAGGGYAASTLVLDQPWQRAVAGASFSLTIGGAKELYDMSSGGDASYRDFTWDIVGTAVGVGVALVVDLALRNDSATTTAGQRTALSIRF